MAGQRCPYAGESSLPSSVRVLPNAVTRRVFVAGHAGATGPGADAPFGREQV